MSRRSLLYRADPDLFSPIELRLDRITRQKLLALCRFSDALFPGTRSDLARVLMDIERHGERLVANGTAEERARLAQELEGLCVEIDVSVRHLRETLGSVSVHIVPTEVMRRARSGSSDPIRCLLGDDPQGLVLRLLAREVGRRVRTAMRTLSAGLWVPSPIAWLMGGHRQPLRDRLPDGACIEDLRAGRCREQFKPWRSRELVEESREIGAAIQACVAICRRDDALLTDAQARYALLATTIRRLH